MKALVAILAVILIVISVMAIYFLPRAPKPIAANKGDEFIIVLDSNKTTGFGWQLAKPINQNMLKLLRTDYIPSETDLVGAGGKEEWTFIAVNSGKATIPLKYARPWEKVKPAKEKTFTIIIK
jgi:predicted secreted protein